MQCQPSSLGELRQEPGDEVRREPADAHVGEIDVRDDQRAAGRFESDVRQGFVGRHGGGAVAPHAFGVQ